MTKNDAVTLLDNRDFQAARQAQTQAADPSQSSWVEANAGSGKTKVLIDRVARLLLPRAGAPDGASPDSILCVTYTKAAANEMLARLYERLGSWSIATDTDLIETLSRLEDRNPRSYDGETLKKARSLFARALETPGGLRIETIHAFCARILRRFPLEAGIPPGFTDLEESEADEIWAMVLVSAAGEMADRFPEALSVVSKAAGGFGALAALDALRLHRTSLLGVAAELEAGSEQIDTYVRRHLRAPSKRPAEIKAAALGAEFPVDDLKGALEEFRTLINPSPDKDKTNKKLLAKLEAVLAESDFDTRYVGYLDAIAGASQDWPSKSNPFSGKTILGSQIANLFTRKADGDAPEGLEVTRMKAVQEQVRAAETAERTIALLQLGLPCLEAYQNEKRARAALDFDDLISRTKHLLTTANAASWVLYKLDGGLSHILLDEAQDTSPAQWALINALVEEFQAGLGRHEGLSPRTQFVVGDSKQSIYSFQGANQQHFQKEHDRFVARFEAVDEPASQPEMSMSFRSSPEILSFVDEVLSTAPLAHAATDILPPREADIQPHSARRYNQPGQVELWPLVLPAPTEDGGSNWKAPVDHIAENAPRRVLAKQIATLIKDMISRKESVWQQVGQNDWERRPVREEDILILVRKRNDLYEAIIDALKQEALQVAGADRLTLIDNIGVQDCLNLMRFALQPADDLTLAEILRGPFCGMTDDDRFLFPLAYGRAKGETLWDKLRSQEGEEFAAARQFCEGLIARRDEPAFDFLMHHLTVRQDDGLSGWDLLIGRLDEPVRDPVRALINKALAHDATSPASLQAFLAKIEADKTELKRDLGDPNGTIRVMTVHGAKGLQAPVVILPDTTSGTRPAQDTLLFGEDGCPIYALSAKTDDKVTAAAREQKNRANERESRRLLYVALTRAQDRLVICGAGAKTPKAGYDRSSWYRWCVAAMNRLVDGACDAPEQLPENILRFGPDVPVVRTGSDTHAPKTKSADPEWLYRSAPTEHKARSQMVAPSSLVADRSPVLAPLSQDRLFALKRGRVIHTLLQILPRLPEQDRAMYAQKYLERLEPDLAAHANEILAVTLRTLRHESFAEIFAKDGRSEVAIVGALPDGRTVNGQVDRLLVSDDRVLIVDYKTDRPAPKRAGDIGEAYIVQMAAYRAVFQQIYSDGRPVECALLYTDGPVLFPLDGANLSESLNRVSREV